ncbi:MAG: squalene/phytoene synthase family protein [Hyphomicrobium sp.]
MRILPKSQREAIYLVYSFCRSVDDIADSEFSKEQRLADINLWRSQINDLYKFRYEGNLTKGYLPVVQKYNLNNEDFFSVLDGMEMDIRNQNTFYDWSSLDRYCDCVASAVGRLSSQIFGIDETSGKALSHHLGRALQLTNILRDIDEDAQMGRFYLPIEELKKQNIYNSNISEIINHVSFSKVCFSITKITDLYFEEAEGIMRKIPRSLVKSPRIMCSVYKSLFHKLKKRGWHLPRNKISIPKSQMFIAIFKYGFI